jgi:hypothetical protein
VNFLLPVNSSLLLPKRRGEGNALDDLDLDF